MQKLKMPKSIQIINQKRLSNMKLSSYNSFVGNKVNKINININPLMQSIRNTPLNPLSAKTSQNQNSFLNVTDKKNGTKSNFFKASEKYFIKQ